MRPSRALPLVVAAAAVASFAVPSAAHAAAPLELDGVVPGKVVCQGDVRQDATFTRLPVLGTVAVEGRDVVVVRDGAAVSVRSLGADAVLGVAVVGADGHATVHTVAAPERGNAVADLPAADGDAVVACVTERPEGVDRTCPGLSPTDVAVTLTDVSGDLRRTVSFRTTEQWTAGRTLDKTGNPVLWNRWTSDDAAVTPLVRAEVALLPDVVLPAARCKLVLTLASYATQGPTWPTSGTQTFLDSERVRLAANRRSAVLEVTAPDGYGQVDLYRGRTVFDGGHGRWHGPVPHYPDVLTPGNGALISAWNGGQEPALP